MEAVFYYATIAAVIAFGLLAGHRWARSVGQAVLLGLIGNLAAVLMLFCATILFVVLSPGSLDPHEMGFRLGALLLFGSAVGAVAAIGGRRRAVRMAARLF